MRIQEQQQHDVLPEHAVAFIPCDCISTLRADKSDEGGGEELVRKKQQQDGQQQDGQQQQLTRAIPSSCSSKSTIAHASTTTSTTATTCARERWQQLRKTMRQLTRGMRKYPIMAKATASSSQQEEDDDPQAVAAGASMLHKDFWLEALDKQHRYGFHLRAFHRAWKDAMMAAGVLAATATATAADISKNSKQNASFFYWLDHGDGKALELPECTRDALQSMCVQYCDEEARKLYQVKFAPSSSASHQQRLGDGEDSDSSENAAVLAEYAATHELVHTDELSKWIFVIDLQGNMYVGRKRKGVFHHSSFVAGAPIFAAGKIMIKHGKIIAIEPHSGHFKPTLRNLTALCHILRDQHVDLDEIAFIKPKKWSCAWPFPDLPPHLEGCELEDLASDTDYYSYKSDSEEQE